ncbi:virion morphogenesis protein [Rhodococcus sp. SRB_17]|uniref:phage virion morphogenesis protein n=1 Tax=Acidovorax sp. SRB_24 TaxID=1962700 RepID=UPI00145F4505|nr:phage virion morphogenesis protein [Acidovorax sp. SRB_24]NMM75353.1 virion morphogenesis protein [Acidovorax sp. SRB_24]NMM86639.1 virion morphogenesis protein [Rhodococcus sp. SRB_17]
MLTITADDKVFRDSLAQLYRGMGNLTPVMQSIGMELESRISGRFESRTDPSGSAWAPWAQSTVDSYPEDGNRRLLDRYGDMLASLSHQADATSVRVGFGQPYAAFDEWGTKHMPRRGLLFADPDAGTLADGDEAAVLDILGVWLDGLIA